MSIDEQGAVITGTLVIYFGVMAWLLYRGQPLVAAGAMFATALIPLAYDISTSPDSEAPGSALLTIFLFVPALMLLLSELCARGARLLLRKSRPLFRH